MGVAQRPCCLWFWVGCVIANARAVAAVSMLNIARVAGAKRRVDDGSTEEH